MIFKHGLDTGMKMFDFNDSKIKSNDTTDHKDTEEEFTPVKSKQRKRKLHHESADKKAPTCDETESIIESDNDKSIHDEVISSENITKKYTKTNYDYKNPQY